MTTYLDLSDLIRTGDYNSRGSHYSGVRSCLHKVATCEYGTPLFRIFSVLAPIFGKIIRF